jgi:glycosyltransferase involved in cell wall biosynthesis
VRPLRIVQLIPSLDLGGAERFATWLAEAHLEAGHDVHVVCVSRAGPLLDRLPAALRARTWVAVKRARYDASVLPRLVRTLRRLRPDVVNTHLFTALAWGGVAARAAGTPALVHTQHEVHLDGSTAVRRVLATGLDAVVGCSEEAVRDVEARGWAPHVRKVCIENGIPLAGRPRSALDGAPLRVGTVGRLVPIKGQRHLIDAVGLLRDRGVDVRLTLFGDGPSREALEAQRAALGLTDRVSLAGAVDDVPERLAGLDLFVLPSLSEAMPMALLEAAAARLPLLVTDAGGAPTLLRAGAGGFVVPPADPVALADRIAEVAAMTPSARGSLGDASLRTALDRYELARTAERYLALYRDLLGR